MDVSYLLFPFMTSFDLHTEKELGTSFHASSGFQDGSRHGFLLTVTTGKTPFPLLLAQQDNKIK